MKIGRPNILRALPAALIIVLGVFLPRHALAQQADIPPVPQEDSSGGSRPQATPAEGERIVEGRPSLYWIRKNLHPLSWFASGVRPLLGAAERVPVKPASHQSEPSSSGIKFGVRGHGQGSGLGPEVKPFHRNLFNRHIEAELPLSVTYKFYQSARARVDVPLAGESMQRMHLELTGRYASRPSENFFGIGNDSLRLDESEFRSVTREAGAAIATGIGAKSSVRFGASYRSIGITHPRQFQSATEVFADDNIPGLTVDPAATLLTTFASIERDTRDDVHLPASGGLQRVTVQLNESRTGGDFSYWQYQGQVQQSIPVSKNHRNVIAIRATLETAQPKGGSAVPFFDLPIVGSYSTLRGFENRRFTDRSAASATLEYRYRIWRHFDWGFFVDNGQVAPEVRNFTWNRLHTGYGTRFVVRAHENRAVIFDFARSRENPFMVYVDFSPLF